MKRSLLYLLAAPIAAALLAATMAGSSAQAPLVQRLLTLRLTEVGGSPAVTTGEVGCTGATINGKQYPGARSFPVPERILDFPFQSVNPPVCTLVLSNLTDDEQLSVTINGVAVPRSGVSIVNAATKEIQATFSPIPLDGTTEVLIRTKPVVARGLKIAQIDASISTEMATQFSFTATVFDCVGVVWTDSYPGTGTENYRKFPGVTSAQCKVRFTPNPGQKVVTDFRTHAFFAAGRLVTPTFEPDGSAVVNFPLAQISGIRVISPATPAAPLSAPATTKPKASPAPPAVGDVVPEDVQDFDNGVCASLNPKTKKVTVGACKGAAKEPSVSGSGLVAGSVSLPENQPMAELLERYRAAHLESYANPTRAKEIFGTLLNASGKTTYPNIVTYLAKENAFYYWGGNSAQFEFFDSTVKPISRTSAEIRTCVRTFHTIVTRFGNDLTKSSIAVAETTLTVKKSTNASWRIMSIKGNRQGETSGCADGFPTPAPATERPVLAQSFPVPSGGAPILEAARKYVEATQESSRVKEAVPEIQKTLVTPRYLASIKPAVGQSRYWTGTSADSVFLRERVSVLSKTKAVVEFCRVYGAEFRDSVTDVVDPESVGVKVTAVKLNLEKIGGKWLVDGRFHTEPDFGYSNCWVGATLPPNLANPRVK
jgi:uncharacterized protein YbbK (DUF523 family)